MSAGEEDDEDGEEEDDEDGEEEDDEDGVEGKLIQSKRL